MSDRQQHWSEEQFSNYVMGLDADPAVCVHLDECAACREELDRFQESIASFSQMSLEWSERHGSRGVPERVSRPYPNWLPTAGWAVAAGLAVGVGLPLAMQHRTTDGTAEVARASTAIEGTQVASVEDENSAAAIARDNLMMMAVANELNRADPTPIAYGTRTPQEQKRRARAREE
jgi:hypothetical protein